MKQLLYLAIAMVSLSFAQNPQTTLLSIGEKEFSVEDFMYVYNKNRDLANQVDPKTVDEYMDLYINFKLKVLDAEQEKLDTTKNFLREYKGYKAQVTNSFLYDKKLDEKFVKEAYERLKYQRRASHILVQVNAQKNDNQAKKEAQNILEQLKKGADFTTLAKKYSEDPSVKENGGDLGFFTTLQMVYPFENAVYNTEKGAVSDLVRTRFGYHILTVTDIRKNLGERRVAHIMLRFNNEKTNIEEQNKKIKEVYNQLENGADFEDLAKSYSDDYRNATRGGLMEWIAQDGSLDPVFEKETFAIQKIYQYSKPFKTQYGYHIVKLMGVNEIGSFENEQRQLERKIENNDRIRAKKAQMLIKLKNEYELTLKKKHFYSLEKLINTKAFTEANNIKELNTKKYKHTLFSYAGKKVTQKDFIEYLMKYKLAFQQSRKRMELAEEKLGVLIQEKLFEQEKSQLSKKYPEYRNLLNEYRDGMLLYEISKQKVWDKAMTDTTGIQNYFDSHSINYQWKERIVAHEYICNNKKVAKNVAKMLKKGKGNKEITDLLNKENALDVSIKEVVIERGKKPNYEQIPWQKGVSKAFEVNQKYVILNIQEILESQPKDLKEVRGVVISEYQKVLEKNWLAHLKNTHQIKINQKVFESVKKNLK